jgi:hypothetical protein
LQAGVAGDRLGGQLVVSAVQVGAAQRQPGVTLIEPGVAYRAGRARRNGGGCSPSPPGSRRIAAQESATDFATKATTCRIAGL